jgi:hypothetical protein
LVLLGAADEGVPQLEKHLRPAVRNTRNAVVGERRVAEALAKLAQ